MTTIKALFFDLPVKEVRTFLSVFMGVGNPAIQLTQKVRELDGKQLGTMDSMR